MSFFILSKGNNVKSISSVEFDFAPDNIFRLPRFTTTDDTQMSINT